jgi:hypothetical protein
MGPVGFRFYVEATIRYLRSDAVTGDSDAINSFTGLLKYRLRYGPAELDQVAASLASVCDYIVLNYERFDLTLEIYGDLRPLVQTLHLVFLELSGQDQKLQQLPEIAARLESFLSSRLSVEIHGARAKITLTINELTNNKIHMHHSFATLQPSLIVSGSLIS